jgi:nickel superoxide dismutase
MTRKRVVLSLLVLGGLLAFAAPLYSHCEIPCGIYDDPLRMKLIDEHVGTIEKSMKQIAELSKAGEKNYNQIVRWVANKDQHADEIQHIVAQYFMTQRVMPAEAKDAEAYGKYVTQLTLLHRMLVAAMKAKQTTDLAHVEALRSLSAEFKAAYFGAPTAQAAHAEEPRHAHRH